MTSNHSKPANTVIPRTRIKVCGIRTHEAAQAAAEAGADAIGFIFVENTPRYIDPDAAVEIMMALPPLVQAIGVTRDLTVEQYSDLEERCPCQLMQLHGGESERTVSRCGPGVVKAFKFQEGTIDNELKRWGGLDEVDAVLVDGSTGGTGESFDWRKLREALDRTEFSKPVFLAGGLHADNVAEAIEIVRPWAVDVSSGVEVDGQPGVKDPVKIAAFCAAVANSAAVSP